MGRWRCRRQASLIAGHPARQTLRCMGDSSRGMKSTRNRSLHRRSRQAASNVHGIFLCTAEPTSETLGFFLSPRPDTALGPVRSASFQLDCCPGLVITYGRDTENKPERPTHRTDGGTHLAVYRRRAGRRSPRPQPVAAPRPALCRATRAFDPAYQRAAIADLKRLRLVPSCAHGSACAPAQTVAAISAVGRFSSAGGVADLQAAIAAGVAAYRAGAVTR
jgi:hypothetical protein